MKPYAATINGTTLKTAVIYVEGERTKLCDGCDIQKPRVASIRMVSGGVECICEDCIRDILGVWKSEDEKTLYNLELHETMCTPFGIHIMRVPGGWIYDMWDTEKDSYKTGTFVEYSNEFQPKVPYVDDLPF